MPSDHGGTPLDPGGWALWEDDRYEVVLDIDPHVAFAYLNDRNQNGGEMVSSVWLFNLPGPQPDADDLDALPGMPDEFLTPFSKAPRVLEDIDVTVEGLGINRVWSVRWANARAVLKPGVTPGYSSQVTSFTPFAHPLEDLDP